MSIESLLEKYGVSRRWLADRLNTSHTNVNSWLSEDGNKPRDRAIYDNMLEILKSEGPKANDRTMRRGGRRMIPVYAGIPAGPPASNSMDVDWEELLDWGNDFERWGRIVSGDSMIKILQPGDTAVFEDRQAENGDVVHAYRDGDDCIKACRGHGADAQLWSFNPEYLPVSASGWKVKGVCVARIRYGRYRSRSVTEFPGGLKWSMRDEDL